MDNNWGANIADSNSTLSFLFQYLLVPELRVAKICGILFQLSSGEGGAKREEATHTQKEPVTLLLDGKSANYCTSVFPEAQV